MDDQRFGMAIRAARLARRWTQERLGAAAGLSGPTVSRLERGHLETLSLGAIRAIASAVDVRVGLDARSRHGDLDRIADALHAGLGEAQARELDELGWEVRPEVSFAVYGERGVVDLVAWHAGTRTLLLVEIKTRIVEVGTLLATLDRRHRLAGAIAAPLGWRPACVGTLLVVADTGAARRRVAAHPTLFETALPARAWEARRWLRAPAGELRALRFLPFRNPRKTRKGPAARRPTRPAGASGS